MSPSHAHRSPEHPASGGRAALVLLLLVLVAGGAWIFSQALLAGLGGGRTAEEVRVLGDGAVPGERPDLPALDRSGFDAGDIISDDLFFDAAAMDEAEVAGFLETWGAGCVPGSDGAPCLARWRADTPDFPADSLCPVGFDGREGDTAASVIVRVAQGCGVSPRVLLVLLQKEQGLVTATGSGLSWTRYDSAAGYACPDTAACDARYRGFVAQLWGAARQFRLYEAEPWRYPHRAGETSWVAWSPNGECGGGEVTMANQATAGLYDYTPYQPNEAALAGGGDECSAWGNLNFHSWWLAWFGPTH